MAVKFPILNVPTIAEPCTQSWELMPGTARIRHCDACNQNVVNLAAMSSAEIVRLLEGPVPCLRIARFDDGTLVTTEPVLPRPIPRIAAGLLTAAMALGAAAQSARNQQITVGAPPSSAARPLVTGTVTDHSGRPLAHATATLLSKGKVVATVKLGPDGHYALTAPAGLYDLHVEAPYTEPTTVTVQLSQDKPLNKAVELFPLPTLGKPTPPRVATIGMISRPLPLPQKPAAPKTVRP